MRSILCFGDSNTWGYDAATEQRLPWDVRWPGVLQRSAGSRRAHRRGGPQRPIDDVRPARTAVPQRQRRAPDAARDPRAARRRGGRPRNQRPVRPRHHAAVVGARDRVDPDDDRTERVRSRRRPSQGPRGRAAADHDPARALGDGRPGRDRSLTSCRPPSGSCAIPSGSPSSISRASSSRTRSTASTSRARGTRRSPPRWPPRSARVTRRRAIRARGPALRSTVR